MSKKFNDPDSELDAEMQVDKLVNEAVAVLDEPPRPAPKVPLPFRPSNLSKLMEKAGFDPLKDDRAKFLRSEGLPPPTRKYRVTGRGAIGKLPADLKPWEGEAHDESHAVMQALDATNVPARDRHRFKAQVVMLEE